VGAGLPLDLGIDTPPASRLALPPWSVFPNGGVCGAGDAACYSARKSTVDVVGAHVSNVRRSVKSNVVAYCSLSRPSRLPKWPSVAALLIGRLHLTDSSHNDQQSRQTDRKATRQARQKTYLSCLIVCLSVRWSLTLTGVCRRTGTEDFVTSPESS